MVRAKYADWQYYYCQYGRRFCFAVCKKMHVWKLIECEQLYMLCTDLCLCLCYSVAPRAGRNIYFVDKAARFYVAQARRELGSLCVFVIRRLVDKLDVKQLVHSMTHV